MPLAVQYAISLLEFVLVVFSILRTAFYESCIYLVSDCFILRREQCSGPYLYDAWRFMSTFCPTQGEFYSAIYKQRISEFNLPRALQCNKVTSYV